MELWEEMLLGSSVRPQGFGGCFIDLPGGMLATCAFGAAMEARGINASRRPKDTVHITKVWPWVTKVIAKCPECFQEANLKRIVFCLNDRHRWTRERIALEFVKPIEESLKPTEVALPAVGVEA